MWPRASRNAHPALAKERPSSGGPDSSAAKGFARRHESGRVLHRTKTGALWPNTGSGARLEEENGPMASSDAALPPEPVLPEPTQAAAVIDRNGFGRLI